MNPLTHRFKEPPRDLDIDAHFAADRSTTRVDRSVDVVEIETKAMKAAKRAPATAIEIVPGFTSRHLVSVSTATNPLPHRRMTDKKVIDTEVAGWSQEVTYRRFASRSAAILKTNPIGRRLRVVLLFGVGSESHRHGLVAAIENLVQPTMLILVNGIEPSHERKYTRPDGGETRELASNNRWGVGIDTRRIEAVVQAEFGRLVDFDVVVCAAFSTGHYGLAGSVLRRFFPLDKLERVVIFDCLYGDLGPALSLIKSVKGSAEIIVYVASDGNEYRKNEDKSFGSLALGGDPSWRYINIRFDPTYGRVAAARVVNEGRSVANPVLTSLPTAYLKALDDLIAKLPPRMQVVSHGPTFTKVRGSVPSSAKTLNDLAASATAELAAFAQHIATTRECFTHGQLLGWPTPIGEEWHDLVLVEFAWEYLG